MPRGTIAAEDERCGDVRRGGRPRSSRETTATEDRSSGDAGAGEHGRRGTRAQRNTGVGKRWREDRNGESTGRGRERDGGPRTRRRGDTPARRRSAARRGAQGGGDGRTWTLGCGDATPLLSSTMPLSHGTWGAAARRRPWPGVLRLAASRRLVVGGARRLAVGGGPASRGRRRPSVLPSVTPRHLGDLGSTSRGWWRHGISGSAVPRRLGVGGGTASRSWQQHGREFG